MCVRHVQTSSSLDQAHLTLHCVPFSTSNPSSNKIKFLLFVRLFGVKLVLSAAWRATHAMLYDPSQNQLPMNPGRRGLHMFENIILLSVVHTSCSNLAQNPNTSAILT